MTATKSRETGALLTIERLVPGGEGMARWGDGRAAFAAGTVPGDQISVEAHVEKKSFVRIESFHLERPGPERVDPRCSVAARCGGCDWASLSQHGQKEGKLDLLQQALGRTGAFSSAQIPPIRFRESSHDFGYRRRVRLHVDKGRLGYFSRRSRSVVEFDECPVANPQLSRVIAWVRELLPSLASEFEAIEEIELRALALGQQEVERSTCSAHLVPRRNAPRRALHSLRRALGERLLVRVGDEPCATQRLESEDPAVLAPPGAFVQVNPHVNRELVARVCELAGKASATRFLDVFCGSGNLSLPLVDLGLSGVGVEQSPDSIQAAQAGLAAHRAAQAAIASPGSAGKEKKPQVEFVVDSAARCLDRLAAAGESFDLIVVDPPRAGAKECLSSLLRLRAPSLLMVSCDPVTLARDLRVLVDGGYALDGLDLFDMFPQTHHFETLAVLRAT